MQFYWAYIANGTIPFDPDVHNVKDERVYAASYAQNEGEFATLSLQLRNPRIGLLNDVRLQWIWASYEDDDTDGIVPFFKGRLIGLPEDMQKELVNLVFRAEPTSYAATKLALAQTLKVAPFWDEVWINPDQRDDPDIIIETRPARYHIDPVSHAVTISDILQGEDGTVVIDVDDAYAASMRFGFGEPPISRVNLTATVGWSQQGDGSVDLKSNLLRAFAAAGSEDGLITTFTGQGLLASWPIPGQGIGGGWAFGLSQIGSPSIPTFNTHANDETATWLANLRSANYAKLWRAANNVPLIIPEKVDERDGIIVQTLEGTSPEALEVDDNAFYIWKMTPANFDVSYAVSRARTEVLTFSLEADVQEVITDVQEAFNISLQSQQLSELYQDGTAPIGNPRCASYFDTNRGKESLRYLISVASRVLIERARTARLSLNVPFALFPSLSTRKSALVIDPNLPGGQAGGKIVGYGFALTNGVIKTSVNISGTIGKGEALPALDDGTPTCVDEDALGPDCQEFTGREISAIAGQVKFTDFKAVLNDDGLNLFHMAPETVIAGSRAKNLFAMTSIPADGDTITIGDDTITSGDVEYTWRDEVGAEANTILIGASIDECIFNLGSAIIATTALKGLSFGAGTVQNELVTPILSEKTDVISLYAREPGVSGNAITASVGAGSSSGSYGYWRFPTFKGGAASPGGLVVLNGVDVQRDVLNALAPPDNTSDPYMFWDTGGLHSSDFDVYSTVADVIETLNNYATKVKMELVPLSTGPFTTNYDIEVSRLMIPNTVDLEAPSNA